MRGGQRAETGVVHPSEPVALVLAKHLGLELEPEVEVVLDEVELMARGEMDRVVVLVRAVGEGGVGVDLLEEVVALVVTGPGNDSQLDLGGILRLGYRAVSTVCPAVAYRPVCA